MNARRAILYLVLLPFLAGGCALCRAPDRVDPPVALPGAFSRPGAGVFAAEWWTMFGDHRLNALIKEAFRGNFSLRSAWDRLDQARAVAARSGAALRPTLDASAGASRTYRETDATNQTNATQVSLGLAAGYEADLWGRIRAARDAAALDAAASREDLNAAAMTLSAEVAGTWYQLVERHGQLALLDEQIKTNLDYLEVITLKFRRGQVSATDVLQQRQLVESTRGERIQTAAESEVLEHQLAVLLGRTPLHPAPATPEKPPVLPDLPQTGIPAEWIRRRPDVRAAELRIQAADRSLAAAIADRFPRLSLSASAQTATSTASDLFDNWLASLAANLTAPLIDGGRRRAEVDRTRAARSEKLNTYGETVLSALKEVEDAITQEVRQTEYVASLHEQFKLSAQSTEQTLENYTKGTMDFTRYLTTLLGHQRLQRTVLRAEQQRVQHRIDLCRALAGGWTPQRPPATPLNKQDQPEAADNPER